MFLVSLVDSAMNGNLYAVVLLFVLGIMALDIARMIIIAAYDNFRFWLHKICYSVLYITYNIVALKNKEPLDLRTKEGE